MQLNLSTKPPVTGSGGSRTSQKRQLALLWAGLLLLPGGCSLLTPQADPTRFYVLAAPAAVTVPSPGGGLKKWRIGLSAVEVPAYLRGKEMVVRAGSNEVHFAEYHRWAESLDQGIGREMKETLGSAANVQSVALNGRGGADIDYEASIRILACEGVRVGDGAGAIGFAAAWTIRAAGPNLPAAKNGSYTAGPASWDGRDYGRLAGLLSEAVAAAGRAVAADLPAERGAISLSQPPNALP